MRLVGGAVAPRVWLEDRDGEPRRICLGLAKLRFAMDVDEAIELARRLVAAVDEVHDQQPKESE